MMQIAKCNGRCPREWLAVPGHVYCGRRVPLRSGKYAGQEWPASPLGNPFRPSPNCLNLYRRYLLDRIRLGDQAVIKAMKALTTESVLGCWCFDGTRKKGDTIEPACHTEVIADVWYELFEGKS